MRFKIHNPYEQPDHRYRIDISYGPSKFITMKLGPLWIYFDFMWNSLVMHMNVEGIVAKYHRDSLCQ